MLLGIYRRSRSPSNEWDRKKKKTLFKIKKKKEKKINV